MIRTVRIAVTVSSRWILDEFDCVSVRILDKREVDSSGIVYRNFS